MKKTLIMLVSLALVAGGLSASAQAKKKKPAPVETTFYLHGAQPVGEAEIADRWNSNAWHPMDSTEPDGSSAKSQFVTNYVGGPRTTCSGNGLLPIWKGEMAGRITGDVTLTLHTAATPAAQLVAVLYPDANGGCDAEGSPSAGEVTVDVAPGQGVTEFVFEGVDAEVLASLALQLHIVGPSPAQVRVFYDAASSNSSLVFNCIPASGTSCTP